MDKCTQCIHLQEEGDRPACLKNCPASAIIFGDINDPESLVSKALAKEKSEHVHTMRNFGNNPQFVYLRNSKWQEVLPQM
jgi:Fe-S-cluster-containing dehydrogenase component